MLKFFLEVFGIFQRREVEIMKGDFDRIVAREALARAQIINSEKLRHSGYFSKKEIRKVFLFCARENEFFQQWGIKDIDTLLMNFQNSFLIYC
jgi:hypothetical protein